MNFQMRKQQLFEFIAAAGYGEVEGEMGWGIMGKIYHTARL